MIRSDMYTAKEIAAIVAGARTLPGRTAMAVRFKRQMLRKDGHVITLTPRELKRRRSSSSGKGPALWSAEEDAILIAAVKDQRVPAVEGRTFDACCRRLKRIRRMGIKVPARLGPKGWRKEEDAMLRLGVTPPGRSKASIDWRCAKIGVKRPGRNIWSDAEIAMIMAGDRRVPGRSWKAVVRQVERLREQGLKVPTPIHSWPSKKSKRVKSVERQVSQAEMADPIVAAVWWATSFLPDDLRAVARSELTIAVLEGRVDVNGIGLGQVREALRAGGDQITVGRYGHVSLYGARNGQEGLTWVETLAA